MNFTVLPEAELEAAEAVIWYDDLRSGLGDDFLFELRQVLDRIRRGPAELPRLETYAGPHDMHRCLLRGIVYDKSLSALHCQTATQNGIERQS